MAKAHEYDASELVAWRNAVMSPWGPPHARTRAVLITLSLQMGFELEACPSVELLAARAGTTDKTVRTHLKTAVDLGWLTSWRETRKGRAWYFTRYRGEWPNDLDPEAFKPGNCRPSEWRALPEGSPPPRLVTVTPRQESRPVNDNQRQVNEDMTTGNSRPDDRSQLPTNSFTNSSLIALKEHHAPRDVFSSFGDQSFPPESVKQEQPQSLAERLCVEVFKVGRYFEPGSFSVQAATAARTKVDQLIMQHGESRVYQVWTQLDPQTLEQLEQAFEAIK